MSSSVSATPAKQSHVRYFILFLLFFVTVVNYADRATLSIAGTSVAREFGWDKVAMGFVFSAFAWSYAIGQIPGGWLLDRFGSKRVYGASLFLWSLFTLSQGFVTATATAILALFVLRFLLGLVESPAFPANNRIVSAWFPTAERGTATAIFNSAQYAAVVLFTPLMGWITHAYGWRHVFWMMGTIGVLLTLVWFQVMRPPKEHPRVNAAEREHLERGGALVNMSEGARTATPPQWSHLKDLLTNRMLAGVYVGQYCITALTYFFITWLPIYLVQARGMSIMKAGFVTALPAICGFSGGILGGMLSDYLLRKGYSVTVARKTPFVLGMLLASTVIGCAHLDANPVIVAILALAFFGKGLAAIGWAVISDASPKEIIGLTSGVFNAIGNVAGIATPIVIGYVVQRTGSWNGALYFVGAHCVVAMASYLLVVGRIERVVLRAPRVASPAASA